MESRTLGAPFSAFTFNTSPHCLHTSSPLCGHVRLRNSPVDHLHLSRPYTSRKCDGALNTNWTACIHVCNILLSVACLRDVHACIRLSSRCFNPPAHAHSPSRWRLNAFSRRCNNPQPRRTTVQVQLAVARRRWWFNILCVLGCWVLPRVPISAKVS